MLPPLTPRHLAQRLARAGETAEHAAEQLYRMRMLEITQLIRKTFPSATTLVVETRNRDVTPEGVHLHAILAAHEMTLWSADHTSLGSPLGSHDTEEHACGDVVSHINFALTSALGAITPHDRWKPQDPAHADNGLYTVELHTDEEVVASTSVAAGKLGAKLHDDEQALWLAEPSAAPTMTVGGVRITTHIAVDGRLQIDIGSDVPNGSDAHTGADVELDVRVDGYPSFSASLAS